MIRHLITNFLKFVENFVWCSSHVLFSSCGFLSKNCQIFRIVKKILEGQQGLGQGRTCQTWNQSSVVSLINTDVKLVWIGNQFNIWRSEFMGPILYDEKLSTTQGSSKFRRQCQPANWQISLIFIGNLWSAYNRTPEFTTITTITLIK